MPSVLAIAAHPDDIEFLMAGTMILLGRAGWDLHCFNLSTGNCGSTTLPAAKLRRTRRMEARAAARVMGASWHPPICDDLEIFYNDRLLRRVAAVVRRVRPNVVLTHAMSDYMEDHMNTARLAVTAAFARGMPNYRTEPRVSAVSDEVTLYHALPHGLHDGLGREVIAGCWINIEDVLSVKREALERHASQRSWLDESQGMDSYLLAMEEFGRAAGAQSRRFRLAEGWRRHHHLGFSAADANPLRTALGARFAEDPRRRS